MGDTPLGRDTALIVVDVQNDFIPGGALPVPDGDEVVPLLNRYIDLVRGAGGAVFASRDWHPQNHISFRSRGGPWPPHCVRNTWGAQFHPDLRLPAGVTVVSKASNPDREAYSAFDGVDSEGTDLAALLRRRGVRRILVGGLATDYCVKMTVLAGRENGFDVWLLTDAIRAIDAKPGDGQRAIQQMLDAGAHELQLSDISAAP